MSILISLNAIDYFSQNAEATSERLQVKELLLLRHIEQLCVRTQCRQSLILL